MPTYYIMSILRPFQLFIELLKRRSDAFKHHQLFNQLLTKGSRLEIAFKIDFDRIIRITLCQKRYLKKNNV